MAVARVHGHRRAVGAKYAQFGLVAAVEHISNESLLRNGREGSVAGLFRELRLDAAVERDRPQTIVTGAVGGEDDRAAVGREVRVAFVVDRRRERQLLAR